MKRSVKPQLDSLLRGGVCLQFVKDARGGLVEPGKPTNSWAATCLPPIYLTQQIRHCAKLAIGDCQSNSIFHAALKFAQLSFGCGDVSCQFVKSLCFNNRAPQRIRIACSTQPSLSLLLLDLASSSACEVAGLWQRNDVWPVAVAAAFHRACDQRLAYLVVEFRSSRRGCVNEPTRPAQSLSRTPTRMFRSQHAQDKPVKFRRPVAAHRHHLLRRLHELTGHSHVPSASCSLNETDVSSLV